MSVATTSRALSTSEDWILSGNNTDILVGDAAYDNFGWSTALSADGSTLAVGAPYNDANGYSAGLVKIFRKAGNSWYQVGIIMGEAAGDSSGQCVLVS